MSILLAGAACSRKPASDEDSLRHNQNPGATVAEVTLTRVTRADVSQTLALSGTIAALPNQDVRVSSLVAGRIAEMRVAEGDHVTSGQLVARIDDRPLRDQLQQAEAATTQARANLDNARLARARNEDLFARGIAARKELEDARTQEAVAAATLRQAEASLALARLQVARAELHSPLTGTVVKRFVGVGEQVDGTAAQPVLEIASLSQVELLGNVPAAYLSRIRTGATLALSSDAVPGKVLSGRVVGVSPAVDPGTNQGLVRIRIANAGGSLRLGMFLTAQVPMETHPNALAVPPQAIYRDQQGQPRVYRVEKDQAIAVAVQIGIEMPDRVELLSGVKEGDTIILTGGYGLGEKARIAPKGQPKP